MFSTDSLLCRLVQFGLKSVKSKGVLNMSAMQTLWVWSLLLSYFLVQHCAVEILCSGPSGCLFPEQLINQCVPAPLSFPFGQTFLHFLPAQVSTPAIVHLGFWNRCMQIVPFFQIKIGLISFKIIVKVVCFGLICHFH